MTDYLVAALMIAVTLTVIVFGLTVLIERF